MSGSKKVYTSSGGIIPFSATNFGQIPLNPEDAGRFWILMVPNSSYSSNHNIAFPEQGGLCIGISLDAAKVPHAAFMPCIVDQNGKPATSKTVGALWNPRARWMAQDSLVMTNKPFPLITIDGKYAVLATSTYNDNEAWSTGPTISYQTIVGQAGVGEFGTSPPDRFTCLPSQSLGPYMYTVINLSTWPGSQYLGCKGAPPEVFFDDKNFGSSGAVDVFVDAGLNGNQFSGGVWIEIRSLPLEIIGDSVHPSTNVCPFSNPSDIPVTPLNTPNYVSCCNGTQSISLNSAGGIVSSGCSNTLLNDLLVQLNQPPLSRTASVCPPGMFGPSCLTRCPNGSTYPNCGCVPGLIANSQNICQLPSAQACAVAGRLTDLQSGGCVCPSGRTGPNCDLIDSSIWGEYFTTTNVLFGLGVLTVVGIGVLIVIKNRSSSSTTSK